MKLRATLYKRHRFHPAIIQRAVWLYWIQGKQCYLWRAVDQDGEVVDVLLQKRRDAVARRELIPETMHITSRYANNRAEWSHQPTRVRERGMWRFRSMLQAQRFVRVHAAVVNLFNLGRHLVAADHYRALRRSVFASWDKAAAI